MDINKLGLTSRDYSSILEGLIKSIPDVSQIWTTTDENDPGIVILKLISMASDMLSYYHDKAVLEVFPDTVKELKNARQVFASSGYNMHWYRSALCDVTITNTATSNVNLPRFTTITTSGSTLTYTYFGSIYESSKNIIASKSATFEAVEGTPFCPPRIANMPVSGSYWHSIYSYNVFGENIVNNRIYFRDTRVDDRHIVLIDNQDDEWVLVDNIEAMSETGKFFSFDIDEDEKPYIKLINNWQQIDGETISKFKLFYIVSSGSAGMLAIDMLERVNSKVYILSGTEEVDISELLVVTNTASTLGYDIETADEARQYYLLYSTTHDTLVTLEDYNNAVKRLTGVSNCLCKDITNDPNASTELTDKDVRIYITRTEEYLTYDKPSYRQFIRSQLSDLKIANYSNIVYLEDEIMYKDPDDDGTTQIASKATSYYYWTPSGTIYLKKPVSKEQAQGILNRVGLALSRSFDVSEVDYNSTIKFVDLLYVISNADSSILYADVSPISYYSDSNLTSSVTSEAIVGDYKQDLTMSEAATSQNISITNYPVKPRSVMITITIGSDVFSIKDDANGKFYGDTTSVNFETSTINYSTGAVVLNFMASVTATISTEYTKNLVGITKFTGIDTSKLIVSKESIRLY